MDVNMDINDELDKLIIQYGIDRYHPRFVKQRNAKKLMKTFWNEYKDKKVILIAASLTDSNYIQEDCALFDIVKDIVLYEQIDNYLWDTEGGDVSAVVVSFYGRREMLSYLYGKGIRACSVYDYLAEHGLVLEGNYYDIFGEEYCTYWESSTTYDFDALDMNAIFFYDRRNYEILEEKKGKEMYLARMIFDCVYVKDWELTEKYIKEYSEAGFPDAKQYEEFTRKIKELINFIKEKLEVRQNDDIVMFWLDQLEYGEDKDMPYLSSLSESSIDFLNAYTVTPYTSSTAKTLFAKQKVADDRAYNIKIDKKCSFIQNMEKEGFKFRFYTCAKQVNNEVKGRICQNLCSTFSAICWNLICDMLKNPGKFCAVLHELSSTHHPYISFGLSGDEYFFIREIERSLNDHEKEVRNRQILESRQYVDNVLRQYCSLLPDSVYKIFMSDHGHTELDKYHTIFRIVQKDVTPQRIKGIFSYINFDKLIYKMLHNDDDYSEVTDEYAEIQDVDYYDKKVLKRHLDNLDRLLESDAFLWGWKGVVTHRHIYIKYNDGREKYYNLAYDDEILTEEKAQYLRSLCTEYPEDIIYDDKFKYTRNTYKTLQNYMKRNGKREQEKKQAIMDLFTVTKSERIALRGGGEHTMRLWCMLEQAQQENILYVIDSNNKCQAARLGLKVIGIQEMKQEKVDMVVISSYRNEAEWYEEMKKCAVDIPVIKLYDYLKERGINCEREFYKREYAKEDIVWEE